jgi:hypothetical protein
MATKLDITRRELTVSQENALDCLVGGMSDQETADAVGTSRQTISVWKNHLPAFQAELNRRRQAVWGASTDRLRSLVPKALTVLEGALDTSPDARVALDVLKLAGLADPAAPLGATGPTSEEAIVNAEILRRREEDSPIEALYSGGRISDSERRALATELKALTAGIS